METLKKEVVKMFSNKRKSNLILFLVTMVLIVTASPVWSGPGGSSGEPGEGCNTPGVNYTYVENAYRGQITLTRNPANDEVTVTGNVAQQQNCTCTGILQQSDNVIFASMTDTEFAGQTPATMRGACLTNYSGFFNCVPEGFLELVGVGTLNRPDANTITFDGFIRRLQEQ
jgi:hypothetical protein